MTRRTPRKKPAFDPQSLIADIDHRDDALLAYIARQNALYDQCDAARRGVAAGQRLIAP